MLQIAFRLVDRQFKRFQALKRCVREKINDCLAAQNEKASKDIETLFKKERWVFTQDEIYQGLMQQIVETTSSSPNYAPTNSLHQSILD